MAAADIRGRGLIYKHPSKRAKKSSGTFCHFQSAGGISGALETDALVSSLSFSFVSFGSDNEAGYLINPNLNFDESVCRLSHIRASCISRAEPSVSRVETEPRLWFVPHCHTRSRWVRPRSIQDPPGPLPPITPLTGVTTSETPSPPGPTCGLCTARLFHYYWGQVKELHL